MQAKSSNGTVHSSTQQNIYTNHKAGEGEMYGQDISVRKQSVDTVMV